MKLLSSIMLILMLAFVSKAQHTTTTMTGNPPRKTTNCKYTTAKIRVEMDLSCVQCCADRKIETQKQGSRSKTMGRKPQ